MTKRMSLEEYHKLKSTDRRVERQPRKQEEHNHQSAFFSIIRMPANLKICPHLEFVFAPPNAAKRTPFERKTMLEEGLTAGVPDIIIASPQRNYPGGFLEAKFGKNTLTPAQERFRDYLISQGYFYRICYSSKVLLEQIEWYFGVTLNK